LTAAFADLRSAQLTTKAACALIGRPRASHYRHRAGPVHGPKEARVVPDNGQALTEVERTAVLTLINTGEYADLSIGQIWARELDEGRYLCSMSTMYRIARAAGRPAKDADRQRIRRKSNRNCWPELRPRCGRGT
jgi:putative transposase